MQQYTLIRSRRRHRSASLNVNQAGEIIVRAPAFMPKFFIDRFVAKSERWITKRQVAVARPTPTLKPHFTLDKLEVYIRKQVAKYRVVLNVRPSRVRLTDARTYWGSCSPRNMLSFSKRLRFAPSTAVTYVVIHELCHLHHRGHGKRFWDLVKKTYPQTNEMKKVLRLISLSH